MLVLTFPVWFRAAHWKSDVCDAADGRVFQCLRAICSPLSSISTMSDKANLLDILGRDGVGRLVVEIEQKAPLSITSAALTIKGPARACTGLSRARRLGQRRTVRPSKGSARIPRCCL